MSETGVLKLPAYCQHQTRKCNHFDYSGAITRALRGERTTDQQGEHKSSCSHHHSKLLKRLFTVSTQPKRAHFA
jgi:hypothetical protein